MFFVKVAIFFNKEMLFLYFGAFVRINLQKNHRNVKKFKKTIAIREKVWYNKLECIR